MRRVDVSRIAHVSNTLLRIDALYPNRVYCRMCSKVRVRIEEEEVAEIRPVRDAKNTEVKMSDDESFSVVSGEDSTNRTVGTDSTNEIPLPRVRWRDVVECRTQWICPSRSTRDEREMNSGSRVRHVTERIENEVAASVTDSD